VFSTIADLPVAVATCGLKSPTLLIVGATVKLSPRWPWRDESGDAIAPSSSSPAYDLQTGLPSEDTREWFTERSRTLGKLREMGKEVGTRGGEPAEEGDRAPAR